MVRPKRTQVKKNLQKLLGEEEAATKLPMRAKSFSVKGFVYGQANSFFEPVADGVELHHAGIFNFIAALAEEGPYRSACERGNPFNCGEGRGLPSLFHLGDKGGGHSQSVGKFALGEAKFFPPFPQVASKNFLNCCAAFFHAYVLLKLMSLMCRLYTGSVRCVK